MEGSGCYNGISGTTAVKQRHNGDATAVTLAAHWLPTDPPPPVFYFNMACNFNFRSYLSYTPSNSLSEPSGHKLLTFRGIKIGRRNGSTLLPTGSGNGLTGTGTRWKPLAVALRAQV